MSCNRIAKRSAIGLQAGRWAESNLGQLAALIQFELGNPRRTETDEALFEVGIAILRGRQVVRSGIRTALIAGMEAQTT